MQIQNLIIQFYCMARSEKEIKQNLSLLGYSNRVINKEFKKFIEKFNTPKQVFNQYGNFTTLKSEKIN